MLARAMWKLIAIALGGALGTALRHGVNVGMVRWLGTSFPWATLAVNVIGSLLLGVLMEAIGEREIAGVQAKLVLGTGVCAIFSDPMVDAVSNFSGVRPRHRMLLHKCPTAATRSTCVPAFAITACMCATPIVLMQHAPAALIQRLR